MQKFVKIIPFFIFLFYLDGFGQSDCSTAFRVCSNAITGGNVSGYGIDDFYGADSSGCLDGSGLPAVEVNSFWFRIRIDATGTFGFNIIPAPGEDWDFAVYGPTNTSCGALGDPVRCNWDFDAGQFPNEVIRTGVGNDTGDGDHYDNWLDVNVGDEFLILVNKFDQGSVSGFEIEWTGNVFSTSATPLDCTIRSDLGEDKNLCRSKDATWLLSAKLAGVDQADIVYNWFLDTGSGYNPIFATPSTPWQYEASVTGRYKVEVTDTNTGDYFESDVLITFYDPPIISQPPNNLSECEVSTNNAFFDLTQNTPLIIGNQNITDPSIEVNYYGSLINATLGFAPIANPNNFESDSRTIWASISNNGGCLDIVSFELIVIDQPIIAEEPIDISVCDSDQSLNEFIDLTLNDSKIIGSQVDMIVLYDDDDDPSTRWKLPIQDPLNYDAQIGTQTIYAIIIPTSNFNGGVITSNCSFVETSFSITVSESPVANTIQPLEQCDDDGVYDGFYSFDFTNQINELLGSQDPSTFEVEFYTDAFFQNQIDLSQGNYTNPNPYIPETIYVKIYNINNPVCAESTSFTLQVLPKAVPLTPSEMAAWIVCDDLSDNGNSDTNGVNLFDLTLKNSEILNGQSNTTYTVNYYEDSNYLQPINNPTVFENSSPVQTIYVEVINNFTISSGCPSYTSFDIQVLENPTILNSYNLVQCGISGTDVLFNLDEANSFLTLNNNSLSVTYFNTFNQAENNDPNDFLPSQFLSSADPDNIVFARLENNFGCHRIAQVNLQTSTSNFPSGYSPQVLSTCDDDNVADGLHTFRLSQATAEIITLFINNGNTNVPVVTYYTSEEDALYELNPINPSIDYINDPNLSQQIGNTFQQDIYVRVESNVDGDCFGIGPYVSLEVYVRPDFDVIPNDFICLNNLPKTITIENPQGSYTYEWFNNEGISLKNSSDISLDVNQSGNYFVVARSNDGCFSFQKQITLTASDNAQITSINVSEDGLSNAVTINITGIGDYEFAIDNPQGNFQDSNTITNVEPGIHTVYVRDKNGCGLIFEDVYVLGYPRFFTPNGDGQNETWNILGFDTNLFSKSVVSIFDRYGKEVHRMSVEDIGWDGFYRGNPLPSTDYWFKAELTDTNGKTTIFKSHFSLIR